MTCPKRHPIRSGDGREFARELDVLGSHATDAWLRCRLCGRMFWTVTDDGKFGYENDWELDPALAQPALVDRDPEALARLFVSMNLPYGPLWDMTGALVEIFRALTPDATDAERARAIEKAGPHPRWSAAARTLAQAAKRRVRAGKLTFPIDLSVPGVSFREWHEVGDAIVLLTDGAELFRLEPGGLVHLPLSATPRYLASDADRLMLGVGDAVLVVDAAGQATAWPCAGPYTVTALDGGYWLFVPDTNDTQRFVELHLPDGRPRVKFPRAFRPDQRWMAPPRRFAKGWLFSNLTDTEGRTQALTLFDADFKVAAASEGAFEGDRTITPIDDEHFWAGANDAIELWRRRGKLLERLATHPCRASWVVNGMLITDSGKGRIVARDREDKELWSWKFEPSGATYGVATRDGVLVYDDEHAHWLDREGAVRRTFDVESADVCVGNKGTVYLKTLAELWIIGERVRSIVVGTDAELETTCGDDAILRRDDGTCLLVGEGGVRGSFDAPTASFSVVGTRGGPWIVEDGRIRGALPPGRVCRYPEEL